MSRRINPPRQPGNDHEAGLCQRAAQLFGHAPPVTRCGAGTDDGDRRPPQIGRIAAYQEHGRRIGESPQRKGVGIRGERECPDAVLSHDANPARDLMTAPGQTFSAASKRCDRIASRRRQTIPGEHWR
jgi:hypothetical protein